MRSLSPLAVALALLASSFVAVVEPISAADQKIDSAGAPARSLESLIDIGGDEWRGASRRPFSPDEALRRGALPLREHSVGAMKRVTIHYTGNRAIYKPELVNNTKERRATLARKLRQLYEFSTSTREGFKKNLWSDVPYHLYLDAYGQVGQGRDLKFQVDSNTRYETDGHLSIVVEGDDDDKLTPTQKTKLTQLLDALVSRSGITAKSQIGVHSDFANTTCPGPELRQFLKGYQVPNP